MNYKIEVLEDQIIEALKSDTSLSGVNIATHAGGISGIYFQDPQLMEGLLTQLPFIFVQYQGKTKVSHDAPMVMDIHKPIFRFFVGAQSLRAAQESQRSAYSILRNLYDNLHGKYFDYTGCLYDNKLSTVTTFTQTDFSQQQPITEGDGKYEQLIVCLPRIVVYSVDYNFQVIA